MSRTVSELLGVPAGVAPPEIAIPMRSAADVAAGVYLHGVKERSQG